MKKILLSENVMVSDPCYHDETWCQGKLSNVLPGYYNTHCKVTDAGDWGRRNSMLLVIHENVDGESLTWEDSGFDIGVDSGQAGIFNLPSYRNDDHSVLQEHPEPSGVSGCSWVYGHFKDEPGDKFYDLMCGLTLNNSEGCGTYDQGVVSRSGFGDGGYKLYIAKEGEHIVAMCIDFGVEEDEVIDFEFYMDPLNEVV